MLRLDRLHRKFEAGLSEVRSTPFFAVAPSPTSPGATNCDWRGWSRIQGNEEPSARELSELSRTAREQGVRVLFNDGVASRLTRRLAEDLKIPVATLETLETGDLRPGAYEEGMRRNLRALREALARGR